MRYVSTGDLATDLWSRVDRSGGSDACWPWVGSDNGIGYGKINVGRRPDGHYIRQYVHRVALELHLGRALRPGMLARHFVCDNPPCCNPAHLREGTTADNVADKVAKQRQRRGEGVPSHSLTEDAVVEMREAAATGVKIYVLAELYGVTPSATSAIVRGNRWAHAGGPRTRLHNSSTRRKRAA